MQGVDDRMQAAYDRMQAACSLHASLVWPQLKRSAGLISSRFPGVSGRHFDENSVECEVFKTVNFNLNKEA